ncbi:heme exporter protein D [Limimonas halophila]|uniref:Heme exporter protein D n=1 Tax=Limimonas halophila TaxID=1082479 RepID=A0A1G7RN47_9PROT|nr:heme exporter protein CcmD [Limimonas halophila]SDG12054.1 heme exporter protein D [Limimonas halophila]
MQAVLDYLAMGGYAAYIWPAYGLSVLVMGGLVVQSVRQLRARQRAVAALERGRRRQRDTDGES